MLRSVANNAQTHYRRSATVVGAAAPVPKLIAATMAEGVSVAKDSNVLQRIASGDQTAVAQCIDEFGGLIWSLARRLTPNESDAEDAVQEIFVEIWRFADRFDPAKASQATFVAMLARRRLIDRLRKHNRQPVEESFDDSHRAVASGEQAAEVGSDVERVAQAMQHMKPEQQQALHLSAWLGMSHAAIAKKMDLPLGTVKSHIRRGLVTIREDLGLTGDNKTRGTLS